MSNSKNTGWNGEFLLMSSMSRAASVFSAGTGSGGIGRASVTGSGGAGGRVAVAEVGGGGAVGRAIGGCFFAHALAPAASTNAAHIVRALRFCIAVCPSLHPARLAADGRARGGPDYRPASCGGYCDQFGYLLRPRA